MLSLVSAVFESYLSDGNTAHPCLVANLDLREFTHATPQARRDDFSLED
jgi:hypothetical protein